MASSNTKTGYQHHRRSRSDAIAATFRNLSDDDKRHHSHEDLRRTDYEKRRAQTRPEYYSSTYQPTYNTYMGTGPYKGRKMYELTEMNQPYGYHRKRSKQMKEDSPNEDKHRAALIPLPAISKRNDEGVKSDETNKDKKTTAVVFTKRDNKHDVTGNDEMKNDEDKMTVDDRDKRDVTHAAIVVAKGHRRSASDSYKPINKHNHFVDSAPNKSSSISDLTAPGSKHRLPPLTTPFLVYDSNYQCSYHVYKGGIPQFRQNYYTVHTYVPTKTNYSSHPTGRQKREIKNREEQKNIGNASKADDSNIRDVNAVVLTDRRENDTNESQQKKQPSRDTKTSRVVAAVTVVNANNDTFNHREKQRVSRIPGIEKDKNGILVYETIDYNSNYQYTGHQYNTIHTYDTIRHYRLNQYPYGPEKQRPTRDHRRYESEDKTKQKLTDKNKDRKGKNVKEENKKEAKKKEEKKKESENTNTETQPRNEESKRRTVMAGAAVVATHKTGTKDEKQEKGHVTPNIPVVVNNEESHELKSSDEQVTERVRNDSPRVPTAAVVATAHTTTKDTPTDETKQDIRQASPDPLVPVVAPVVVANNVHKSDKNNYQEPGQEHRNNRHPIVVPVVVHNDKSVLKENKQDMSTENAKSEFTVQEQPAREVNANVVPVAVATSSNEKSEHSMYNQRQNEQHERSANVSPATMPAAAAAASTKDFETNNENSNQTNDSSSAPVVPVVAVASNMTDSSKQALTNDGNKSNDTRTQNSPNIPPVVAPIAVNAASSNNSSSISTTSNNENDNTHNSPNIPPVVVPLAVKAASADNNSNKVSNTEISSNSNDNTPNSQTIPPVVVPVAVNEASPSNQSNKVDANIEKPPNSDIPPLGAPVVMAASVSNTSSNANNISLNENSKNDPEDDPNPGVAPAPVAPAPVAPVVPAVAAAQAPNDVQGQEASLPGATDSANASPPPVVPVCVSVVTMYFFLLERNYMHNVYFLNSNAFKIDHSLLTPLLFSLVAMDEIPAYIISQLISPKTPFTGFLINL